MRKTISTVRESDLASICSAFHGDGEDQAEYLEKQANGEGVYLVFWCNDVPLGHLFLRWAGSHEIPRIRDRNSVAATIVNCPSLDALWVRPGYRSKSIGTQLIREAEKIALSRGYRRVCLTVDIANRAKRLYERLGYVDPGIGPFHTSGTYTNADGEQVPWDNGIQLFLMQVLAEDAIRDM